MIESSDPEEDVDYDDFPQELVNMHNGSPMKSGSIAVEIKLGSAFEPCRKLDARKKVIRTSLC